MSNRKIIYAVAAGVGLLVLASVASFVLKAVGAALIVGGVVFGVYSYTHRSTE